MYLDVNRECEISRGFTREEFSQLSYQNIMKHEDLRYSTGAFQQVQKGGGIFCLKKCLPL